MSMLFNQNTKGCCQDTVLMAELELADGKLTAEIPANLDIMPGELAEMYYPYDKGPDVILADSEISFQMTFWLLLKKMTPGETGKAAEAVRIYCDQLYPQNKLTPVHLYQEGEIPVAWFTMELQEKEEIRNHVKAVFSYTGRMFLMTATYSGKECLKWNSVIKHFFSTLHEKRSLNESHRR